MCAYRESPAIQRDGRLPGPLGWKNNCLNFDRRSNRFWSVPMRFWNIASTVFVVLASMQQAGAAIVAGGDGTQNSTSSGAGGGWAYVSPMSNIYGAASVVYLGEYAGQYWALRSRHSGSPADGTLSFNGVPVNRIVGSEIQVLNDPNDPGSGTDLVLFRIDADPGLANLNLIENPLAVGTSVKMIGNGRNRDPDLTMWRANWTETTNPMLAAYSGYKWDTGNTKRWGDNVIHDFGSGNITGQGIVDYFRTDFDNVSGEAQGATGDSGGGAFFYDPVEEDWYLAGVMITVGTFSGQPAETAVFGNVTYLADISQYSAFILNAIPEPSTIGLAVAGLLALGWRCRRA